MHISEQEKHRMEKEHHMRHGYQIHKNREDVKEHQFLHKDMENKHARESQEEDYGMPRSVL